MAGADDDARRGDRRATPREVGLAFQIVDDILDVEGDAAALGKTAGKDAAAAKPTYPALFGLDRSRALAAECLAARARGARRTRDLTERLARRDRRLGRHAQELSRCAGIADTDTDSSPALSIAWLRPKRVSTSCSSIAASRRRASARAR